MRTLASLLLVVAACSERNPAFCDVDIPCADLTLVCNLDTHRCQGTDDPDSSIIGCSDSDECPGSMPICTEQQCSQCSSGATGDTDCAARDPAATRCADDGTCVECLDADDCGDTTPVCDPAPGSCRACAAHSECASEVCAGDGSCVAAAAIVYVDAGDGTDSDTCGDQAAPCATLGGSQGGLDKIAGSRRTVRIRAGTYAEDVDIDVGGTVILIGDVDDVTVNPAADGTPAITVRNGSDAVVDGLTVTGATGTGGHGIRCESSSSLVVRGSVIRDNDVNGLLSQSCMLTLERTRVTGNQGGGISVNDAAFTFTNCLIAQNGDAGAGGSSFGGIQLVNSSARSPQLLEFVTVTENQAATAAVTNGILCSTTSATTGSSSIVYAGVGGTSLVSGNCTWSYSDVQGGPAGSNNNIDEDPQFVNPVTGDFHLMAGSPCRNTADPDASVLVDLDGDPRPEGNSADMGADEFRP